LHSRLRPRLIEWIAVALGCAIFTIVAALHGTPALRHDWFFPQDGASAIRSALISWSGWYPGGFGSPAAYVNDYLGGLAYAAFRVIPWPLAAFAAMMFALAFACVAAGRRLAQEAGAAPLTALAAGLFVAFNPWMYTQIVSGHVFMIAAYAALAALVAETLRAQPRPIVASLLAAATLEQMQFFMLAIPLLAVLALRNRLYLPLATAAIVSLPFWVGIAANAGGFARTPFTFAWEASQSVAPAHALTLTGYFARYTDEMQQLARPAVAVVALIALMALVASPTRRLAVAFLITALLLVASMGVLGPFATPFAALVAASPAVGLFRELYDLIGVAALGYALLASAAAARWPALRWPYLAAALALIVAWAVWPPSRFWVDGGGLPRTDVSALPDSRYAIVPAFPPLQFGGKGSGLQPDATLRAAGVDPLNESALSWPANSALAAYQMRGDPTGLAALSVTYVASPAGFETDVRGLADQLALPDADLGLLDRRATSRTLEAQPEISLVPVPPAVALPVLGSGSVFFADVAGLSGPLAPAQWREFAPAVSISVPNRLVRARDGWVDARLAFAVKPELGQAFGGALTTSPDALLAIQGGLETLVFVSGKLLAEDGSQLAATTRGYRWIRVPGGVRAVRCAGLCVVALQGTVPAALLVDQRATRASRVKPLPFRRYAPWLIHVVIPAGDLGALRYNAAFAPRWSALAGGERLTHVRLDTIANGWLIPGRVAPLDVWLIYAPAAWQFGLEIIGAAWILALLGMSIIPRLRRR
jgi:hypothetical protein